MPVIVDGIALCCLFKTESDGRPKTMIDFGTGGTPWHILIDPKDQVVFDGFSLDTDAAIAHIRSALVSR